jgi:hypothetical protein
MFDDEGPIVERGRFVRGVRPEDKIKRLIALQQQASEASV